MSLYTLSIHCMQTVVTPDIYSNRKKIKFNNCNPFSDLVFCDCILKIALSTYTQFYSLSLLLMPCKLSKVMGLCAACMHVVWRHQLMQYVHSVQISATLQSMQWYLAGRKNKINGLLSYCYMVRYPLIFSINISPLLQSYDCKKKSSTAKVESEKNTQFIK